MGSDSYCREIEGGQNWEGALRIGRGYGRGFKNRICQWPNLYTHWFLPLFECGCCGHSVR